ncbi:MAG: membrane protein insertase YidC [Tannerella sp.]|jgi:YidC/Oxa1 family membrane protein insertase|nr:membrane protein insertase YidC [Tannerella sp.]
MSVDKNTVIGFILIGVVLFVFSWLNRPDPAQQEAQQRYLDSLARVEYARQLEEEKAGSVEPPALSSGDAQADLPDSVRRAQRVQAYGVFAQAIEGTEEFVTLENDKMELKISSRGGRIYSARLKEYKTFDKQPLILFDGADESSFCLTLVSATNRVVNTDELYFTPVGSADSRSTVMRLALGGESYLDFRYTLSPDDYMLHFSIQGAGLNGLLSPNTNSLDLRWHQKARQLEQGRKYENQYTGLYYKYASDDVESLNAGKDDEEQISNRLKWIGYKNKFFSTVWIADDSFFATRLQSKQLTESDYLKEFTATTSVAFDLTSREPVSFRYYIGPNRYQLLRTYDKGLPSGQALELDKLVPLGMSFLRPVNKYFIVPIFDFLGNHFSSYGLIIFLLTLIVNIILFPLTYKSLMSSARMRVLRPQVEAISAKYPKQEQAMERQKATMDLYSRAGASPMSGCVPMLLKMPILFALYQLFPTSFELRQESFLWAKDLSTFDPVITWDFQIPFISSMLGNHLSLFCLLVTIVNLVYSKFSMDMANTGQQQMPGMKMMMYFMPLMMLFFFNQSSSGLSYYFLVSMLITIGLTFAFRFFVNEKELLLKLEANKKKPRKKSGFMQRLEEAQRVQQEQLRKQQQQRAGQQRTGQQRKR